MVLVALSAAACGGDKPPRSSVDAVIAVNTPAGGGASPAAGDASAVAGSTRFEAAGAEIYLPDTYEGGDPSVDVGVIVERLKQLGPDFAPLAETIEKNPSAFAMIAVDASGDYPGANVNITKQSVLSTDSVESEMKSLDRRLPPSFHVRETSIVTFDRFTAGRAIVDASAGAEHLTELIYFTKEGKTAMWGVAFTAMERDFDELLAVFERSMRTFKLPPGTQ